jgi:hypothetical protein
MSTPCQTNLEIGQWLSAEPVSFLLIGSWAEDTRCEGHVTDSIGYCAKYFEASLRKIEKGFYFTISSPLEERKRIATLFSPSHVRVGKPTYCNLLELANLHCSTKQILAFPSVFQTA